MGIQPEKREQEGSDMGESVFPETDPISLFWGLLIYTRGSAVSMFIKIRCFA